MSYERNLTYNHGEAFNLMTYRCPNGHTERVWNSRDGVTPFMMQCRYCDEDTQHVDWRADVRARHYQPVKGERIWRDGTPEEARAIVTRRLESARGTEWERPESEWAEIIDSIVTSSEFQPGWPMLEVIGGL